jgi:DNA-damage-inducible protein J
MAPKLQTRSTAKAPTKPATKRVAPRRPAKSGFINARVEPKLKKSAEAVLDKIGLSTTDAVTIFLKQVVAQKGMPFPVKIPNRETIKAMRDAEAGRTESFAGTPEQLFTHILGKKRR